MSGKSKNPYKKGVDYIYLIVFVGLILNAILSCFINVSLHVALSFMLCWILLDSTLSFFEQYFSPKVSYAVMFKRHMELISEVEYIKTNEMHQLGDKTILDGDSLSLLNSNQFELVDSLNKQELEFYAQYMQGLEDVRNMLNVEINATSIAANKVSYMEDPDEVSKALKLASLDIKALRKEMFNLVNIPPPLTGEFNKKNTDIIAGKSFSFNNAVRNYLKYFEEMKLAQEASLTEEHCKIKAVCRGSVLTAPI